MQNRHGGDSFPLCFDRETSVPQGVVSASNASRSVGSTIMDSIDQTDLVTHLCPIKTGAGGLISEDWCIDTFAERLVELPDDLSEKEIIRPELLLWERGPLSIYYVPFERVNPAAKVFLVGLTPGLKQMWLASMAATRALREGLAIPDVLTAASMSGAFGGPMRDNLVKMLDGIGVAAWLGLESTALIWTSSDAAHLGASTSALLHPVFVNGENYSGSIPRISDVPILSAFVDQVLAADLAFAPEALVIPLGKAVSEAVNRIVRAGHIDSERVLFGFPHPSGANGHRPRQYEERRIGLTDQVERWASRD